MTHDKSLFISYNDLPSGSNTSVQVGNGDNAVLIGKGTIHLTIHVENVSKSCELPNVHYAPDLTQNLVSVFSLDKRGLTTVFANSKCIVQQQGYIFATGSIFNNLYKLDIDFNHIPQQSALVTETLHLWHQRLAHVDHTCLKQMCNQRALNGINFEQNPKSSFQFDHCVLREGHRTPIPQKSTYSSSKTLELVHSDLCGPLEGPCLGGSRYFMTSIHDFSRWTTVHTIKNQSDTPQCFIKIHKLAETHTGCKLKIVRTDNGWEYVSNDFIGHLNNKGIVHHTTNRYTPHRNGAEERMSLTLVNRIRSMLQTNSMSKYFWAEALERAAYIRSRVTR